MNSHDVISQDKFDEHLNRVIRRNNLFKITVDDKLLIGCGSTANYCGRVGDVVIGVNRNDNRQVT